ncbi:chemotaxis-specific protein-glutamate methyltransferase CheB [Sphingomonas cavernae]|uniref:protein-glutamate methylesterase n=2 Tax=Sphingomonas cavernae TaxID=2320861 RepID=A0A418W6D1_9SPHN|nr:chemotaxis-specific protein-glutamate methyltransferase CheB [Sphingomonas cavernae]
MIVDDSAVARAVLARMISGNPAFEIVDQVAGAQEALDSLARVSVDVILLDIEMPGRNGIAALPELIEKSQGARILIVSALAEEGAATTVEALTLGAADTLAKPGRNAFGGRFSEILCERLMRLGTAGAAVAPGMPRQPQPLEALVPVSEPRSDLGPIQCVAIGASTGGLHAITEFFRALPDSFDAPILITQHLPEVFMPFFAQQLRGSTGRKAVVAREGMTIERGVLHIAPGNAHLCVERHGARVVVRLSRQRVESRCLPSVDPMFDSVAEVYGDAAVGIVLSGMGRDGCIGADKLAATGAELLVQNIDSSVVWGMPGSIAKAGIATAVLPPAAIATHLGKRRASR